MSLHLEFEPHSWYMNTAIDKRITRVEDYNPEGGITVRRYKWNGYFMNGMTGLIVEFHANTLADLKKQIKDYRTNETARIERLYTKQ